MGRRRDGFGATPPHIARVTYANSRTAGAPGASLGLDGALRLLDDRLRGALAEAERRFGPSAAADPYRGLYLAPNEVEAELDRPAGTPVFPAPFPEALTTAALGAPQVARLRDAFALTPFDIAVLIIAAAPELDLRYERVFAVLHDDVTRRRLSVDLALDLLCESREEKLLRRSHFTADAPLVRAGLIALTTDPNRRGSSLLPCEIEIAPPLAGYLLGASGPAPHLRPLLLPDPERSDRSPLSAPERQRLARALYAHGVDGSSVRILFRGGDGSGRHATARYLAARLGTRLLPLDAGRGGSDGARTLRLMREALLEAHLQGWVVYLEGVDEVAVDCGKAIHRSLMEALRSHPGPLVISGSLEAHASGDEFPDALVVEFPPTSVRRRRAAWRRALTEAGFRITSASLRTLAERFELTPRQVHRAVTVTLRGMDGERGQPGGHSRADAADRRLVEALFAASRAQTGEALTRHAKRLQPAFGFDDLILPPDGRRQLEELCERVRHRHQVLERWDFRSKLPLGSGLCALFSGPSGTGKTMAAQVVARELGLELHRIDLSQVVSKYIGETEKSLSRVFEEAEGSNSILFFDEADTLFGKRSEVKDAHDRYANLEVGYLLQRIEEHPGITILATNLRQNLDEAFVRRLAFHIHFPIPEEDDRIRIWEGIFPARAPRSESLDLPFLGNRFRVSGGNIRNAAVAAAFLAAEEETPISTRHVVLAMRREYQKMGKACVDSDFAPYHHVLEGAVSKNGSHGGAS